MVTEFRVGRCKADVVILNGTGTVYEIKSERDSLSRLKRQVEEYSRVFATVNVIVGKNHLKGTENVVPSHVGIMVLSDRYHISTLRSAIDEPGRTETSAIFDAINQREASMILKELGIDLPVVPNTQRYQALKDLFLDLAPETAHRGMVSCLKKTRDIRSLQSLLESVPESLYAGAISARLSKREQTKLLEALSTPIHKAVAWG